MKIRIRKLLSVLLLAFLLVIGSLFAYLFIDLDKPHYAPDIQSNIINDITQLNPIEVTRVIAPTKLATIVKGIKDSSGRISIGGGRFSQGGQVAIENSIHFDMRTFNRVLELDITNKQVTVQSGITWRDLLAVIDPHNLSVKIMQTYANFTVGGSLSVNVHGRYIGEGPIIRSVDSIKLVLADGRVVLASASQNAALFYAAIGGYGGIGVIAEVTLNLADNIKVKRFTETMDVNAYGRFFKESISSDESIIFHNADIYPPKFSELRSVSWKMSEDELTQKQKLIAKNKSYKWQPKVAEFVADSDFGKWTRQHILEPILYSFSAVQWRNYEASYDVYELEPKSRVKQTYALREYFVPIDKFDNFLLQMTDIFKKHQVNVINVSVRHALPDSGSLLAWAKTEVFAFVIYYRQENSTEAQDKVELWSREIVDAVIEQGGTYYLPYQLHATTAQFLKAYPNADEFFQVKKSVDPDNRFMNKLWAQHFH
ncbi:FAD-binding protein [Paraglaciecola sp. L3A3]|uniref:FAD-dependent oxidoreductase n=1 Tax=Paraglaciecola sp. L3A3 TaxID=2686358 RepID=UPI001E5D0576|nr:FAD-binding oxidoreductase [Paraglaciecola sp. L3A3]